MTKEQWLSIKPLLLRALELPPAERAAYLAVLPPDHAAEVRSLLQAYEKNSAFLEAPLPGPDVRGPSSLDEMGLIGRRVGPYRVVSLLGHGGMGSVWLAERADGLFSRQVALKLVQPSLMGRVMSGRVAREREILASLNHPNIARLFDAGFAEDGQPYLALEYIAGRSLTSYCDDLRLSIRRRLELFAQVLDAVQYAHAHGVIHRDLKPSNILVSEDGQAHLLDFGIAKLLVEGEAKETQLTQLGGRALTLGYAAPEQIAGTPITTAADVYALGVILYELMTGERPYRLKRESLGALEDAILKSETLAPSRLSLEEKAAAARSTSGKKLLRALKGDLDTITCKALKKEPGERYATANAFGEDIARYLSGDVVLAQPDSVLYRTLKFVSRHRVPIAGIGVLILTLAGGLAATTYEARVAASQRDAALQAQLRSLTQTAAGRLANGDIPGAWGIILEVLSHRGRGAYAPEALNTFQELRAADAQIAALVGHDDLVESASFSPDGRRIVTASVDHTARVWDAATGHPVLLLGPHVDRVLAAAFSPDSRRIVTACWNRDAYVWDAISGREILVLRGHTAPVRTAAFSHDGRRIVTASFDNTARIWDATSGKELLQLRGHTSRLLTAAFSPDGRRIVTTSYDQTARIWDALTGRQLLQLQGHTAPVSGAAFSPDGGRVVTASFDQSARLWNATTGQELVRLIGHGDRVQTAHFSPDGARIVTASYDGTARLWQADSGRQVGLLSGHRSQLTDAEFSPDGQRIVTASLDKTARIWAAVPDRQIGVVAGHAKVVSSADFSPDGTRLVTGSFDQTIGIWDAALARELRRLRGHSGQVMDVVFSSDGARVLSASYDGTARIWDAASGLELVRLNGHQELINTAAFSRDDRRVVTASDDKSARIWDAVSGREMQRLAGHLDRVTCAAFSPDGRRVVTTSTDRTARIWDARSGRQLKILGDRSDKLWFASFSPDGKRIVTASDDGTARIWDAESGRELSVLSGHSALVTTAVFSTDGRRLVTASWDRTVRVWDAATGQQLMLLRGHENVVESATFSRDGERIVTASDDRTARIWDARTAGLDAQIAWARAAQFDPLSATQRFQLGILPTDAVRSWPPDRSRCDDAAAAPYDPDRHAPGVILEQVATDIAMTACTGESTRNAGRTRYQRARALLAIGKSSEARAELEAAVAAHYRAAWVDLARLLWQGAGGAADPKRAIALYEQAWDQHVPVAAFELGSLYEHGLASSGTPTSYRLASDQRAAWLWYARGAAAAEPNALARFAERASESSVGEENPARRQARLLEAFGYYTAATERARVEEWPDDAWKAWRYRRASLARLLARDGAVQEVAAEFERTRSAYGSTPSTN